jgi:predicted dehydrogenase
MKQINVGIIGAGLIGDKRAAVILNNRESKLVGIADPDFARAKAFGEKYGVEAYSQWKELLKRVDLDAVIIAVPNAFATPIVLAALAAKKHVLIEKPFGVTAKESSAMLAAAKKSKKVLKVGFNHRFHEAIIKAHEIFENGGIGKVLFIRSRYGHGGRVGMEKEWRFNKKISGGGELLDQGVHLIDLARWFGGEMKTVYGLAQTKFWKTEVDDNAFALMANDRVTVSFHASTTQWKNLFSFEVYGDLGYLEIVGKGGSYGEESLTYGKTNLGFAPKTEFFTFNGGDQSWQREWANVTQAILEGAKVIGDAEDGLRANQIIEALYKSSEKHVQVSLKSK